MKCSICGKTADKTPLYRNNEKGKPADWRCYFHLDKEPDKEMKEFADLIHSGKETDSFKLN